MQICLKMVEKLDNLLDETDEYIKCATMHSDNSELKDAYVDLARCHYDGYEKLSKICTHIAEQKAATSEHGHTIMEMVAWHKEKFDERARKLKDKMMQVR